MTPPGHSSKIQLVDTEILNRMLHFALYAVELRLSPSNTYNVYAQAN